MFYFGFFSQQKSCVTGFYRSRNKPPFNNSIHRFLNMNTNHKWREIYLGFLHIEICTLRLSWWVVCDQLNWRVSITFSLSPLFFFFSVDLSKNESKKGKKGWHRRGPKKEMCAFSLLFARICFREGENVEKILFWGPCVRYVEQWSTSFSHIFSYIYPDQTDNAPFFIRSLIKLRLPFLSGWLANKMGVSHIRYQTEFAIFCLWIPDAHTSFLCHVRSVSPERTSKSPDLRLL